MPPLLDVRCLTVDLPTERGWIRPLDDVSFTLDPGESLGIVGESGSGKTMLGLSLMGLLPPAARVSGEILLRSRDVANSNPARIAATDLIKAAPRDLRSLRGRDMAMIFQEPMTALNPLMRVGKQIEEAIAIHDPACSARDARRRTIEVLARVAVPEPERIASQFPHQLSGGLRQRAMIAMAISAQPRLLIADEPTTALDPTVQKQILELLAQLQHDLSLAMIFISHDLAVVASLAHRIAVMYTSRIIEQGSAPRDRSLATSPVHGRPASSHASNAPRGLAADSRLGPASQPIAPGLHIWPALRISSGGVRRGGAKSARGGAATFRTLHPCSRKRVPMSVKPTETILSARDLHKTFSRTAGLAASSGKGVVAVDGISFDLNRGETLGIAGESGCGKTTLARILVRLSRA